MIISYRFNCGCIMSPQEALKSVWSKTQHREITRSICPVHGPEYRLIEKTFKCELCRKPFTSKANNAMYCPGCRPDVARAYSLKQYEPKRKKPVPAFNIRKIKVESSVYSGKYLSGFPVTLSAEDLRFLRGERIYL